jgi:hypothetical protein
MVDSALGWRLAAGHTPPLGAARRRWGPSPAGRRAVGRGSLKARGRG